MTTRETIEAAFRGDIDAEAARDAVDEALGLLDRGEARLAEPGPDGWTVHGWLQQAILLHFRLQRMEVIEHGPFTYHDKIPLKGIDALQGVRVVPPATILYAALVFGERLSPWQWVGALLVLVAVVTVQLPSRRAATVSGR